jgi:hypothetical protein
MLGEKKDEVEEKAKRETATEGNTLSVGQGSSRRVVGAWHAA